MVRGSVLMTLVGLAVTLGCWSADDLEPDDAQQFRATILDAANPDFFDGTLPTLFFGDVPVWLVQDRVLASAGDLDWFYFDSDRYQIVPKDAQIEISGSNLRVEVLGYQRDIVINPASPPAILQSCTAAPTGTAIIFVDFPAFHNFLRIRSCNSPISNLQYDFEYRIIVDSLGFAPTNVSGKVFDIRNGRFIPGAYVFSNENSFGFTAPDNGQFDFAITSASSVFLDFFAPTHESLGTINIGAVAEGVLVENIAILAQPAGMVFYSGFE